MKKTLLTVLMCTVGMGVALAQSYKETFDSNSLEWTERPYKNPVGNAVIEKGVMTVSSFTKTDVATLMATGKVVKNITSFETHCYAPIDVEKPFTITSHVLVKKGIEYGVVVNYRDDGNFYAFTTDGKSYVRFSRYENTDCVGSVVQGVKWKKRLSAKEVQTWTIKSNGSTLEFVVNNEPILKMRYMPLQYSGFGYYTLGECELVIDDVTFTQNK